jgi:predicted membrane-bound spermidine synthase
MNIKTILQSILGFILLFLTFGLSRTFGFMGIVSVVICIFTSIFIVEKLKTTTNIGGIGAWIIGIVFGLIAGVISYTMVLTLIIYLFS